MVGFVIDKNTGVRYAGKHLLVDLKGCRKNQDIEEIKNVLIEAAKATGATVLFAYGHPFEPCGSSGAIILAESHVTWHLWPEENNFMALDIFVCGDCDPELAIPVLVEGFDPEEYSTQLVRRG